MRLLRFIKLSAIALILSLQGVSGYAEESTDANAQEINEPNAFITLQDYLNYAQLHNAGLKTFYQQWQDTVKGVPRKEILDPKLTYDNASKETDTPAEKERQKVGLNQSFGLFGIKAARQAEAQAKAEAARLKYEAAKLDLFRQVKDAFYEYAYIEKASGTIKEHIDMIERLDEKIQQRYGWSAKGYFYSILINQEKTRLEDMLFALEQFKRPVAGRLNIALNREQNAEVAGPVLEEFEPAQINHMFIVDVLRQKNPELLKIDKEIEAAKNKAKLAKAQSYPDVGVGVDFVRTERSMSPDIRPNEKDPTFVTFSVKMPFWGESQEAQQKANEEIRKKELERIEAENSILAKAGKVIYGYEAGATDILLYKKMLLAAGEDSLKTMESRFNVSMRNLKYLLDAQRSLLSYQMSYARLRANNRQKMAELEMLSGTTVEQQ